MKNDDARAFWENNVALAHLTPPDERWCEGFPVHKVLRQWAGTDSVLDFGCGDGRLTGAFEPGRYSGVDINPTAIEQCRLIHRAHAFNLDDGSGLPEADAALCYTVLLHIDDASIERTALRLSTAARKKVLVVEILGRRWRGKGLPRVYNRELGEYQALFVNACSMQLSCVAQLPYNRYGGVNITFIEFIHGSTTSLPRQ